MLFFRGTISKKIVFLLSAEARLLFDEKKMHY